MEEGVGLSLSQVPRPKGTESELTPRERLGLIEEFVHDLPESKRGRFLELVNEAMIDAGNADFDPLTGLRTNIWITKYLKRKLAKGRVKGVGVLFTDIDDFKNFNTNHGHAGGDKALAVAGTVLRSEAREDDEFGRLSERADEFIAVLLSANDFEGFSSAARRIYKALNDPAKQQAAGYDLSTPLTISVGCAWIDWLPQANRRDHGERMAEALLENADEMMYRCKRSGRVSFRQFKFYRGETSLLYEGDLP